jgi:hypothetical protein
LLEDLIEFVDSMIDEELLPALGSNVMGLRHDIMIRLSPVSNVDASGSLSGVAGDLLDTFE